MRHVSDRSCLPRRAPSPRPTRSPPPAATSTITPLIHSSVQIEHAGKVIQVDPWSVGDLSQAKPADLILITDDVGHHLDVKAIAKLRKPGAPVVMPASGQKRIPDGIVLANGGKAMAAGHRHRVDRGLRHQAGRAGASQGRGQRLRDHPRRQADSIRRRHRVRARGARAEEHRRRVHADEHPGRSG